MNMRINYDAILDACAMAGVHRPVRDIEQMLLGKMKMDGNVKKAIESALKGEQHKSITEPLRVVELTTDAQLEQVYALVESGHYEKKKLLELSGLDEYILTQVLQRLRKGGKIHCAGKNGSYRWLVGEKLVKRTTIGSARAYANKHNLKHYEGAEHEKCGTTKKYTRSGNCVMCHSLANKNRYLKPIKELLKQN